MTQSISMNLLITSISNLIKSIM